VKAGLGGGGGEGGGGEGEGGEQGTGGVGGGVEGGVEGGAPIARVRVLPPSGPLKGMSRAFSPLGA